MREHPVPCCICRRDTFHDNAVCDRGACQELMAHSERRIQDRLAAKAIRHGSEEGSGPRPPDPSPFAAVVSSTHGTASAHVRGISSTGPAGCSPARDGSVDPSGSGSTRFPSPDERPSVAPLPTP